MGALIFPDLTGARIFDLIDRFLDAGDNQSAYEMLKKHGKILKETDRQRYNNLLYALPPELCNKIRHVPDVPKRKVKKDFDINQRVQELVLAGKDGIARKLALSYGMGTRTFNELMTLTLRKKDELERRRKEQAEAEERKRLEEAMQQKIDKAFAMINNALSNNDFLLADMLFEKQAIIPYDYYLKKKLVAVKNWFENHVKDDKGINYYLDNEQAMAVVDAHKNTLVAARAGSGKTRTIVAKLIYLINRYHLKPNEILCFVFNVSAHHEINDRLKAIKVDGKPVVFSDIATTFHAFARTKICVGIGGDSPNILINDREHFIQSIINKMPKDEIYTFFKNESFIISKEKGMVFADESEYYEFVRNMQYRTLDGGFVKSVGEKIIADYLFEHGVRYRYEPEYYYGAARKICRRDCFKQLKQLQENFGEDSIKPDFVILDEDGREIPWEHWGITGHESESEKAAITKSGAIGDYNRYYKKMLWKQWFYKKEWVDNEAECTKWSKMIKDLQPLIETHYEKSLNREEFEKVIEQKLAEHGIKAEKLPQDELVQKVWEKQIKYFTEMMMQFIDRAEQQFPGEDGFKELKSRIEKHSWEPRTGAFYRIGIACYRLYIDYLTNNRDREEILPYIQKYFAEDDFEHYRHYNTDFNMIMHRAAGLIRPDDSEVQELLSHRKVILIDEYQDFTNLFYSMITRIRNVCPHAKIFAVGDDWQAIYRFAGSDVDFFKKFQDYFPEDNKRLSISYNYRCRPKIVEVANHFVTDAMSEPANIVAHKNGLARVEIVEPNPSKSPKPDALYYEILKPKDGEYEARKIEAQYLKNVSKIVEDAWNRRQSNDEKVLIMHRKKDLALNPWRSLESFKNKLMIALRRKGVMNKEQFEKFVQVNTVHSSKGLEAETVILLEVDNRVFPNIHPDTMLYQIFGDNVDIVLSDQKRLFYVALTRAKNNLYIFHTSKAEDESFTNYIKKGLPVNTALGMEKY